MGPVKHRQQLTIAPQIMGALGAVATPYIAPDRGQIIARQQWPATGAEVGGLTPRIVLPADRAFQMRKKAPRSFSGHGSSHEQPRDCSPLRSERRGQSEGRVDSRD